MSIPVTIQLEAAAVRERLAELIKANTDLTPLMGSIAGFMMDRVEENFAQEGRPAWSPLKPSTIARRGGNAHPILQDTGQLAASVTPSHDATSAVVGTNKEYARTMQEGAAKGSFGQFSLTSGKPRDIPWGDIPPRPFLMLTAEDQGDQGLMGLVIDYEKNAGAG